MKVKEFIKVVNYEEFAISINTDKGLKIIFEITSKTPVEYLSEKLLDSEIDIVLVTTQEDMERLKLEVGPEEYEEYNDEPLFNIVLRKLGD